MAVVRDFSQRARELVEVVTRASHMCAFQKLKEETFTVEAILELAQPNSESPFSARQKDEQPRITAYSTVRVLQNIK